jgi:hypothetical protein
LVSALDRTTSDIGELTRDEFLDNVTLYWLTNTGSPHLVSKPVVTEPGGDPNTRARQRPGPRRC